MAAVLRSFYFEATASIAPLAASLPSHSAVLDYALDWNRSNRHLPKYLNVATIAGAFDNADNGINLMGPPIHVRNGDDLSVVTKNSLATTGLSIHWHGFEMEDLLPYDGVVGITQCPISPGNTFAYNFTVNETPGTYWYHTHSGELGIDAYNAIRGPLIVHPAIAESGEDDEVTAMLDQDNAGTNYNDRLFYGNERILFFSDGSHLSDSKVYLNKLGGLNPPISFNDDELSVGTFPWGFGTCNGKMREVVDVSPGKKYKFRIINAGHLFALRIALDGFKLRIVAADSEPVDPYVVDEVILHNAERFDVEIEVPADAKIGATSWIRADTLESRKQGYTNGIRAVLRISDDNGERPNDEDVPDPILPIATEYDSLDRITMNCLSRYESEKKGPNGQCIPITELRHPIRANKPETHNINDYEHHTIDFEWSASPQFAHFTSIDGGDWLQHTHDVSKSMIHPSFVASRDLHPNAAIVNVAADSTAILIWRNKSQMDHPIHLHGLKMEILDLHVPNKEESCVLNKCSLSEAFSSRDVIDMLAASPPGAVLKDSFILPAGGAAAVRIRTGKPAIWFAHCHLETHREDGMALMLNVGNYQPPSDDNWLPKDFPRCDTPFVETKVPLPSCRCYSNEDAVLGGALSNHWCSREHLCFHENGQSNLDSYPVISEGLRIQSQYKTPGWVISLIFAGIFTIIAFFCAYQNKLTMARYALTGRDKNGKKKRKSKRRTFQMDVDYDSDVEEADAQNANDGYSSSTVSFDSPFRDQLKEMFTTQWKQYRPTAINKLRVVEVVGLAFLTGALFYDVGNDTTTTGFAKVNSLLFFSITLWTFTRMYTAVGSYFLWYITVEEISDKQLYALGPVCLARLMVVMAAESFWPFIYVMICYPLAGVFGDWTVVAKIGMFLCLNNVSYISLGSCLGLLFPTIPHGMMASTLLSQTSLVAAGFYTTLPIYLSWIRYISPVFWAFSGIVKTAYNWSDTYKCRRGSNLAGTNKCFIEFSPVIDNMKERGINVAVYGDDQSDKIWLQVLMLLSLLFILQATIYGVVRYRCRTSKKQSQEICKSLENSCEVPPKCIEQVG